jgi:hypothetical protein
MARTLQAKTLERIGKQEVALLCEALRYVELNIFFPIILLLNPIQSYSLPHLLHIILYFDRF